MPRNKLAKLLLDEQNKPADAIHPDTESDSTNARAITKFGLEQITNLITNLQTSLQSWNPDIHNYNPLFELAKIAFQTQSEQLAAKCHEAIAKYTYPQIRSLEVQSKQDNNITLNIKLADYAKSKTLSNEDVEELEAEDIDETPHDYADMVLKAEARRAENEEAAKS